MEARPDGCFDERKHLKQARFGAEDVREAFLLVGGLSLQHALPAAGAAHMHGLKYKKTHINNQFVTSLYSPPSTLLQMLCCFSCPFIVRLILFCVLTFLTFTNIYLSLVLIPVKSTQISWVP